MQASLRPVSYCLNTMVTASSSLSVNSSSGILCLWWECEAGGVSRRLWRPIIYLSRQAILNDVPLKFKDLYTINDEYLGNKID